MEGRREGRMDGRMIGNEDQVRMEREKGGWKVGRQEGR